MYTLEEALNIDQRTIRKLYRNHLNSGLLSVFRILGFDKLDVESSEGAFLKLKTGEFVLDFTSGLGVLNFGHNNKRIILAEKTYRDKMGVDILKFGPHPLQAVLAANLAKILPGPLDTCFFTTTGAESVEAALKLVTRAQPSHRDLFIRMANSYHGKTHGALSLTDAENYGEGFHLGLDRNKILTIPFNDIKALEDIITKYGPRLNSIIVEPVQGQTLETPDKGYLKAVVENCHKNNTLVIFDEIKSGMGRCGSLLASEQEEAIPDVVTLSKSLGGGIRAIGAMVTTSALNKRAYGKTKNSTLHTSTFHGIGSSCAVAIESLHLLTDEDFKIQYTESSTYLKKKLLDLKNKYPSIICDVVGKGMMLGVRFKFNNMTGKILKKRKFTIFKDIKVILMGSLVRKLFKKHNVMTAFSAVEPDILYILPPLNIKKNEVDLFIDALDSVLNEGIVASVSNFIVENIGEIVEHN